jgi:hypothetical protein
MRGDSDFADLRAVLVAHGLAPGSTLLAGLIDGEDNSSYGVFIVDGGQCVAFELDSGRKLTRWEFVDDIASLEDDFAALVGRAMKLGVDGRLSMSTYGGKRRCRADGWPRSAPTIKVNELIDEMRRTLRRAGWVPGRHVDTSTWRARLGADGLVMHAAAEGFLSEFGGLAFADGGPGISRAREPLELDPLLALGEDEMFREWGELIGEDIFPIGELDNGRYFLGIGESGPLYLVSDWLARFGVGLGGMENLVLGDRPETVHDSYPLT